MVTPEELNRIRNLPMVFVLGKGRSGTTLLQSMLNTNSHIVAPPEAKFIMFFHQKFGRKKSWTEKDIIEFINALYKDEFFVNLWSINRDKLTQRLMEFKGNVSYSVLCNAIYMEMVEMKQDVKLLVDKNPTYSIFIDKILKVYPQARFIHMVREPRDNIYSSLSVNGLQSKNPVFLANQWLVFNQTIEKAKTKIPERFFTIQYEEMVKSPADTMKKLCAFLNVPYEEQMLVHARFDRTYSEKARRVTMETHKNLSQSVNSSHIGKWMGKMSEADAAIAESITGEFARKVYGYEMDGKGKSFSGYRKLKGKVVIGLWQMLTRFRYSNYGFNVLYCKFKRGGMLS